MLIRRRKPFDIIPQAKKVELVQERRHRRLVLSVLVQPHTPTDHRRCCEDHTQAHTHTSHTKWDGKTKSGGVNKKIETEQGISSSSRHSRERMPSSSYHVCTHNAKLTNAATRTHTQMYTTTTSTISDNYVRIWACMRVSLLIGDEDLRLS